MKIPRRAAGLVAAASAAALALSACSPAAKEDAGSNDPNTITFRLWDNNAVPAYKASFKKFMEKNPGIKVKIEVVPWEQYWDRLPLDISSGDMADVYWANSSNFAQYADNGSLIDVGAAVGPNHDDWEKPVVDLYTRNGKLWGVPQLWDSIGLYYNRDLVEAANVDVNRLAWAPDAGEGDTLLEASQRLTADAEGRHANEAGFDPSRVSVYGFNAQADIQAIYLPFLAQAGASYQDSNGRFAFASPEGQTAIDYLVDMIGKHRVAPPAGDTNTNGDATRDLFVQGKLALYQSGPYNLKTIAESAKNVRWGIAPLVSGPRGRISTVHGVAAVGNAKTKNKDATTKLLAWLGTKEGQLPLAEQGVAFPGVVGAQGAFVDYWKTRGVDVSAFVDAAKGLTTRPPTGPKVNAGTGAYEPKLLDVFSGAIPVGTGLKEAQEAGNSAME